MKIIHFYIKEKMQQKLHLSFDPSRFEPATVRLEGECSIQLSYETELLILAEKGRSVKVIYGKDSVES